jgi:hypothetical protein
VVLRIETDRNIKKPGVVVPACNPSYSGGRGQEGHEFEVRLVKINKTLSQKQNFLKWGGGKAGE